jgi:hypothetical protein
MGFKTDGSVHHSGILNEKAVIDFLNTRSTIIAPFFLAADGVTCRHKGGTGTKADGEIYDAAGSVLRTISIKHHKLGTFDWVNSSAVIQGELDATLRTSLATIKAAYATHNNLAQTRREVDDMFATQIRALPGEFIRALLADLYAAYSDYVLITHSKKGELIAFEKSKNLLELNAAAMDGWTYELRSLRAKTSAQIWRVHTETGTAVNTSLRLRINLNNGVTAFLGLSAANKSAAPCLKIQQDGVDRLIAGLIDPVREAYVAAPVSTTAITAVAAGGAGAVATTAATATDASESETEIKPEPEPEPELDLESELIEKFAFLTIHSSSSSSASFSVAVPAPPAATAAVATADEDEEDEE